MKKEKQIQIVQQIFDQIKQQKNKTDADGVTYQIDANRYVSQQRLTQEKETIFSKLPIVVGASGQLKENGDYFLHDLSQIPIMVVKGKDGQIRAFLNLCRHRGVRLLQEENGHIKRNIVCPYHAWAYDTEGCLKGIFHPQGFEDVDSSSHSLIELDCWVRLGMIFVLPHPEHKGQIDIDEWLSEVYAITEGFDFGDLHPYYFTSNQLSSNWKLLVDGALEGYHFKIAHAQTIGPYFLDNMSVPLDNQLHSSIVFPKKAMKKMQEQEVAEWNFRKGANVLLHIFPNTIILIEPDHIMAVCFYPMDEKTTLYKSFMLLPKEPTTDKEKEYWDLNASIFWNAIQEDNEMAELQQRSFNGYADTTMTVGSYEKLIVQFEKLTDQFLQSL